MSKFSMKIVASAAIIGGIAASAVSASAALNLPTQSCSYMFNTNMKLGSRGADVKNLQTVLNMYPQTRVAASGVGSAGNESTYFGAATRAAVNKFQALHLVELGITAPTGNVFAGTRGLLNQVCGGSTVSTLPAGCTSATGFSPVTGASCATGSVTTGNVVSGPVSATLASSQPTGMIVQKQSGARLADITFTGNGSVTSLQLQRVGVSADATLNNVYLYDGNTRITDAASVVTGGYINFNASNGLFTVNGSRTITVRADIADATNGQSVGVKLNSVTAGGSVSTFTNVIGNSLQIGSVATASVNFATIDNTGTCNSLTNTVCVNAGTTNYNVWSGSATVSTRNVNFKAATFKFVGSAPVDSIQNLSLYVDGTKVSGPTTINAANNNKVTFDFGATPFLLTTGSHTIDVRGDVVKGSARTMTFSVENVADLMFEDSSLSGVNVSATVNTANLTQGNATYKSLYISKGSVTANVDPSFNATKVTGGATNVPVGQFLLKAYGEDVKVNSLQVNFSGATSTNNISLYANGGQIGTSQNYRNAALSYTLGSSLIIPAGQTVVLTVKADVVDANSAAWTTGSITTTLGGVASNAQGQSSYEIVDVANPSVAGNTLTISSGAATFATTAGFTAVNSSPNTAAVKIGSFTIQAGAAEAIKINSIGVNPVVSTYAQTNISNLTLKSGSTVLGTPVGNPAAGTTTFSFSDITIPANGTQTFDVYADLGGATTGSTTAAMSVTYRGAVSNTTTVSSAAGVAITTLVSTLTTSTKSASSPVAQFVVGGSTFNIATFTLKTTSAGMNANVRELRFSTYGTSSIESMTVGGVTAPVVNGSSTVTGLNIAVSSTGTDVPVTVKFAGYQNTTNGGTLSSTVGTTSISLTYVEATSGSGSVITNGDIVASNNMMHVASKPSVTVSAGNTDTLVLGAENKVGEFTVTADANGKIALSSLTVATSSVGITGASFSAGRVADGNTTISTATFNAATNVVTFSPVYEISAGTSKTFSLFAVVSGTAQTSITPYVTSSIGAASAFNWVDVIGGNTAETGTAIYNFPTNSFTTKR